MDSASLFLLTHAVVHRKLVRDKAIQECIDSIRDGSVGGPETTSIIQTEMNRARIKQTWQN